MVTSAKENHQTPNYFQIVSVIVSVLVVVMLGVAYFFVPQVHEFFRDAWNVLTSEDKQVIKNWVAQFGVWGAILLLLFYLVQMVAFVLPSWLLIIVSILAYGPFLGGIISLAGITLAATVAYAIGSVFSELTLRKMLGEKSERKMRMYLDRYGFWMVFIFRLAPFLSNDVISYVAGLTTMSYKKFISGTVLGISPLIILIAYLGETNERLRNGFIIVSVVSLIGFALYIWWDRKQHMEPVS